MYGSYVLDSRPSSEFRYEAAKDKLVNLELYFDRAASMAFITPTDRAMGDFDGGNGRQGQLMKLAGHIDLDSFLTVSK